MEAQARQKDQEAQQAEEKELALFREVGARKALLVFVDVVLEIPYVASIWTPVSSDKYCSSTYLDASM